MQRSSFSDINECLIHRNREAKLFKMFFKIEKHYVHSRLYIHVKETTFVTTNLDYGNAIVHGLPTSSE